MIAASISLRTAFRLIDHNRARSTVVAGTIAVPAAIASAAVVAGWTNNIGLPAAAVGVTMAMLAVAQTSPEPISLASAQAWRAAGADDRAATRTSRIAACLLGWVSVISGVGAGALLGGLLQTHKPSWRAAAALATALLLAVPVSGLFARPLKNKTRSSPTQSRMGLLMTGLVVVWGGASAIALVGIVRNGFEAWLVIPTASVLTAVSLTAALGPLWLGVLPLVGRVPRWQPAVTLAVVKRPGLLVRAVCVVAMVVAATATILGNSVSSRDNQVRNVISEFREIPVLPPNVMALTLPPPLLNSSGNITAADGHEAAAGFSLTTLAAATTRFPGSEVTPVRFVEGNLGSGGRPLQASWPFSSPYPLDLENPVLPVVSDPRLNNIYRQVPGSRVQQQANAAMKVPETSIPPELLPLIWALSGNPQSAAIRARLLGHQPLPNASWQDFNYFPIDVATVTQLGLKTSVRTIFISRSAAYSTSARQELRVLANELIPNFPDVGAITSDQRTKPFPISTVVGLVPWAPTAASSRWSIAALAGTMALMVFLGTGALDALDRRRDNRRLERLGATPNQVRAGAALNTGLGLGLCALLVTASVVGLVARGVHRYSTDGTGIPIPFAMPWLQVAFLTLAVPVLGAAMAAAIARLPGKTASIIDA